MLIQPIVSCSFPGKHTNLCSHLWARQSEQGPVLTGWAVIAKTALRQHGSVCFEGRPGKMVTAGTLSSLVPAIKSVILWEHSSGGFPHTKTTVGVV